MIYEGIFGPHEGFQTLKKEPSDFPGGDGWYPSKSIKTSHKATRDICFASALSFIQMFRCIAYGGYVPCSHVDSMILCKSLHVCYTLRSRCVAFPTSSLCISITWNWFAGLTSWFTRASSTCLRASWWPCGLPLTTAIAVVTLPRFWISPTLTRERPSSSKLCQTLRELYHRESQHHTSCEQLNPLHVHDYFTWCVCT